MNKIRIIPLLILLFTLQSCKDEMIDSTDEVIETVVSKGKITKLVLNVEHDTSSTRLTHYRTDNNQLLYNQGDSALCYNISTRKYSVLYYDTIMGSFIGDASLNTFDEISILFPYINDSIASNRLSLLASLNHSYYWGFTNIIQVSDTTTASIKLFDLMARCTISVVDENNCEIMTSAVSLSSVKGKLYSSRILNLHTGQFENGTYYDSLILDADNQLKDGSYEFNLFPTSALLKSQVTDNKGNIFEGLTSQTVFNENQNNILTIQCTTPKDTKDYISVCGIQWAKGNLLFAADESGAQGFHEHWRLGTTQYEYFNPVYGKKGTSVSINLPYDTIHVHVFNWGTCGLNSLDITDYGYSYVTDISGKLFVDKKLLQETNDFEEAKYGDLAYWASYGKWRMPTSDELYTLYNEASYSCGYVTTPTGQLVWGFLFKTPEGGRVTDDTTINYFTDDDLRYGLFLPGAGFREKSTPYMKRVGKCGFYWDSAPAVSGGRLCLRFISNKLYWSGDGSPFGRSIRPVLCK